MNTGMTRSQSTFSLDDAGEFIAPSAPLARFNSEADLQNGVGIGLVCDEQFVKILSKRQLCWKSG